MMCESWPRTSTISPIWFMNWSSISPGTRITFAAALPAAGVAARAGAAAAGLATATSVLVALALGAAAAGAGDGVVAAGAAAAAGAGAAAGAAAEAGAETAGVLTAAAGAAAFAGAAACVDAVGLAAALGLLWSLPNSPNSKTWPEPWSMVFKSCSMAARGAFEMKSISYQLRSFSIKVRLVMTRPFSCTHSKKAVAMPSDDSRCALIK